MLGERKLRYYETIDLIRVPYPTKYGLLNKEALALVGACHQIPIDKARKALGYVPRVQHDEGLAAVARYLRQHTTSVPGVIGGQMAPVSAVGLSGTEVSVKYQSGRDE